MMQIRKNVNAEQLVGKVLPKRLKPASKEITTLFKHSGVRVVKVSTD